MLPLIAIAAATPVLATPAYTARGQQPDWSLTLAQGRATLTIDKGRRRVALPLRAPIAGPGGTIRHVSVSATMSIIIAPFGCRDTASGARFADTVTVGYQGTTYRGCGGAKAMTGVSAPIENIVWVVERIAGRSVVANTRATIEFRDGRVAGMTGCNSFSGIGAIDGARVRFGAVMSTQIGCAPALMQQEAQFIDLLRPVMRWRIDASGALIIEAPDGRSLTARRTP